MPLINMQHFLRLLALTLTVVTLSLSGCASGDGDSASNSSGDLAEVSNDTIEGDAAPSPCTPGKCIEDGDMTCCCSSESGGYSDCTGDPNHA
ncbi:MAG TPA: hypothetical protein EYN66_02790 [Myxococcales bacterium]|nr:hypothetical protein [Myxococcales bacterium]